MVEQINEQESMSTDESDGDAVENDDQAEGISEKNENVNVEYITMPN